MSLEQRYRRLLRWFPREWRETNGVVLIGTALDAAEADRRDRPSAAEAWSMRLNGLGYRLDARTALVLSLVATVAALVSSTSLFGFSQSGVLFTILAVMVSPLGAMVPPALCTWALCAILRQARLLSPARAAIVGLVATPAWLMSFLTALSWSVGFAEADAGLERSPLTNALPWLLFAAWIIGGIATFLALTDASSALPKPLRRLIANLGALILPPLLGLSTISPLSSTTIGLVLFAVAATQTASPADASVDIVKTAVRSPLPRSARVIVGISALISGVICISAVVFAFAGSMWVTEIDSTRAMQMGIAAGFLGLIPLTLSLGLVLALRYIERRALLWGSGALYATSLLALAVPSLLRDTGSDDPNWLASTIGGASLGMLVLGIVRLGRWPRAALAIVVASAYTLLIGWATVLYLPFLAPFAATFLAIWGLRRPRGHTAPGPPLRPQLVHH